MVRIFLLLSLLFVYQSKAQFHIKKNTIPNVVPVLGDFFYMAETEVSNEHYREFLLWLKKHDTTAYHQNMPDTQVWRGSLGYNEPFVVYYLNHPAYRDYPVVGVTQAQATAFCQWLRERLLEYFVYEHIPITDILVRLPNTKEWEKAARGGLDASAIYPWPGDDYRITEGKKRDLGKIRYNGRRSDTDFGGFAGGFLNDAGFITTPVYSYWPNGYGLYNMSGNVGEWVLEIGNTKGGSWLQSQYHCRIDVPGQYDGDTQARSNVGFRYVIEILRTQPNVETIDVSKAKNIEKEFAAFDTGKYAGIYEVSNQWYQTFLQHSGLQKFAPNDSLWLLKDHYLFHSNYSKIKAFQHYPVVNITHESAEAYCKWLTDYYNNLPNRKFNKVQFYIPSAIEWEKAAHGNRIGNRFPWGGPYSVNSRGCYLANFHPIPLAYVVPDTNALYNRKVLPHDSFKSRAADGAVFTAPIDSYFPNDFGLYNMSGNAAEMVDTLGVSVGGSWDSEEYFMQIGYYWNPDDTFMSYMPANGHYSIFEKQTVPNPTLGFRVFMRVIKE